MEIDRDIKQTVYGTETCFTSSVKDARYTFSQMDVKGGFDTGFLKMENNFITNVIIHGSVDVHFIDSDGNVKKNRYKEKEGWIVLPNGIHRIVANEDTVYFRIVNTPLGNITKFSSVTNIDNKLSGRDHVVQLSSYNVVKPWGGEAWLTHPDYWRELGFGLGPYAVKRIIMNAKGKQSSLQVHEKKVETNVVIHGSADVLLGVPEGKHDIHIDTSGGMRFFLKRHSFKANGKFDGWSIPPMNVHRVINTSDYYEAVEASTPELDDIIRLLDDTNRGAGRLAEEHNLYKVCILAAGKGTKVSYATDFNKALLPIGKKSALTICSTRP